MAIADDISVSLTGDIRYTGSGTTYKVLELHRFLMGLADDAQASSDDFLDIVSDEPSDRSTDNIITLNSPYNIDDTLSEYIYDGSVTQDGGDVEYGGLTVVGVVESGTEPVIVQDNKILAAYWGTGINAVPAQNIIMKIMVKTRLDGADIDGKKIRVMAREFQDSYAEFDVTLGQGNSTAAIFTSSDLNATTAASTIAGWAITNTEGFQEIDIDGTGASGQEYYSQWNKDVQSLNETYEYTKWIQVRAAAADSNTETGDDWTVDNATIESIGTEFSAPSTTQILTEAKFRLKIGAGTPTGVMYATLIDSDDASPAAPTGAVLATSESLNTNRLTTSYQECIFRFNDDYSMVADQEYFIVINHPDGAVGDYVEADGDTTSGDDGNYAHNTAGWTGVTGDALWFEVNSCPVIHGIAGEKFRGISVEVGYDGGGSFTEDETVIWGTKVTMDAPTGSLSGVEYVTFDNAGTWVNAGKVLYTNDTNTIWVALEDSTGATLADGYYIRDRDDPTTNYSTIDTTILDQDKAGGEGLLLATDDNGVTGELYMQVLSGSTPVEDVGMYGLSSTQEADATSTINTRTISPEFVGQSTGTNIIGAYGIGFEIADVGLGDKFFDLSNSLREPENTVTFTVGGLISGDRVLVGPESGSALNTGKYTLDGAHNSGTQTTITVDQSIDTETPPDSTGNSAIRVQLNSGIYLRQPYNSWSGSVFNITSADYASAPANDDNEVFPGYIDIQADATSEAFTAVHGTNRPLLIRVRQGGGATPIKTAESVATFTSSAQTVTISRIPDY